MPPAAGGLSPRTSTWKTMTPVGARSRAPTGVIVFPKGFQRGSAPCRRRHSSFLLLNVYATVACRRRLQKAPRRIHERLPRTHSRPAQGLGQRPQARLGHARSRQRQRRPRPGLAESGCAQEKAELYLFREGRKMPSAAGGSAPRPRFRKWTPAREAARQQASLFSPRGFPKGLSSLAAGGILPLCFLTFTQLSLVADDCKSSSSNP